MERRMTERDTGKFAIVPIYSDSTGAEVKFPGAIMTGDMTAVMARIKDSRQMREDLRVSNEASKVRKDLEAIRQRERTIAARADAIVESEDLIRQLCDAVNTLIARVDAFEEQALAKAEAEEQAAASAAEFALPPGVADEDEPPFHPAGDLHALAPSRPKDELERAASEDGDGEGDLPNELLKDVPPVTGTDPEFPGPREPEARNPVGISW
jgi:hypothetical protein